MPATSWVAVQVRADLVGVGPIEIQHVALKLTVCGSVRALPNVGANRTASINQTASWNICGTSTASLGWITSAVMRP
jgi:hypothetical protein